MVVDKIMKKNSKVFFKYSGYYSEYYDAFLLLMHQEPLKFKNLV